MRVCSIFWGLKIGDFFGVVVRKKGLEPSRQKVQTPEACASTNSATFALRVGDPDESRTHDHRLRKPILYPPELRDHT